MELSSYSDRFPGPSRPRGLGTFAEVSETHRQDLWLSWLVKHRCCSRKPSTQQVPNPYVPTPRIPTTLEALESSGSDLELNSKNANPKWTTFPKPGCWRPGTRLPRAAPRSSAASLRAAEVAWESHGFPDSPHPIRALLFGVLIGAPNFWKLPSAFMGSPATPLYCHPPKVGSP